MIARVRGDLFQADVEALVNPVNCVGVMGAGLAATFKRRYPDMFQLYRVACVDGRVKLGGGFTYPTGSAHWPYYIINVPTKEHWRDASTLAGVTESVRWLVGEVWVRDVRAIAIPALGCGLGGLHWADVAPVIEEAFRGLPDVRVELYEP